MGIGSESDPKPRRKNWIRVWIQFCFLFKLFPHDIFWIKSNWNGSELNLLGFNILDPNLSQIQLKSVSDPIFQIECFNPFPSICMLSHFLSFFLFCSSVVQSSWRMMDVDWEVFSLSVRYFMTIYLSLPPSLLPSLPPSFLSMPFYCHLVIKILWFEQFSFIWYDRFLFNFIYNMWLCSSSNLDYFSGSILIKNLAANGTYTILAVTQSFSSANAVC